MFDAVHGHERVKTILERMVNRERLPHGLLFYGPSGIGKRLVASELARKLICGEDPRARQKFNHGNHPDFALVTPQGADIKVDQIRAITEQLHFKPYEGLARVMVLDQAERMREGAANAFLKSLEEPPDYVYFILICSDLKALLPTIRSRCQKLAFQSLAVTDKAKILQTRFGKAEEVALRLAQISFRALETDDEAWDRFQEDLGRIFKYFSLVQQTGQAIDFLSDLLRDKVAVPRFKDHLVAVVHELARQSVGLSENPLFADHRSTIEPLLAGCRPHHWREVFESLLWLEGQRRRNLNQALWFNTLSVTGLGQLELAENRVRKRLQT